MTDDDEEDREEPYSFPFVEKLIAGIVVGGSGRIRLSDHAKKRMSERGIFLPDILNVLRGGNVDDLRLENGTWRYCCSTPRYTVVVAFRGQTALTVVTVLRRTQ